MQGERGKIQDARRAGRAGEGTPTLIHPNPHEAFLLLLIIEVLELTKINIFC